METTIANYLDNMTQAIHDDLGKLIKIPCQAKCANGKRCKFAAMEGEKCCKKHNKVIIETRDCPSLTYHNHLPGLQSANCPACRQAIQTVGINS